MNLRCISIFNNLSDEDLSCIRKNVNIEEKLYKKGEQIFRVGEVASHMYYLIEGSILVYKIDPNGKRFIIKKFNDPSIFGEVYSYLAEPFDFSAEAERDSKILIIHDFRKIFETDISKEFLKPYIDLLSKKCIQLSRTNQITSQSTLRQKIAKYLVLNQEDLKVSINQSREEWADILATTRPSLSRELSNMIDDGLISLADKSVEIKDIKKLGDII